MKFHLFEELEYDDLYHTAVPLMNIHCHIAQGTILHINPPQWVTVCLDKVCSQAVMAIDICIMCSSVHSCLLTHSNDIAHNISETMQQFILPLSILDAGPSSTANVT